MADVQRETITIKKNLNVLKIQSNLRYNLEKVKKKFDNHKHINIATIVEQYVRDGYHFYAMDNGYENLEKFVDSKMVTNEMTTRYWDVVKIIKQLIDLVAFLHHKHINDNFFNVTTIFVDTETLQVKYCPLIKFLDQEESRYKDSKLNHNEIEVKDLAAIIHHLLCGQPYQKGDKFQFLTFNDEREDYSISRFFMKDMLQSILKRNKIPSINSLKYQFFYWDNKKCMDFILDVHSVIRMRGFQNIIDVPEKSWIDSLPSGLKKEAQRPKRSIYITQISGKDDKTIMDHIKAEVDKGKYKVPYSGLNYDHIINLFRVVYQHFDTICEEAQKDLGSQEYIPVFIYQKHGDIILRIYDKILNTPKYKKHFKLIRYLNNMAN